MKRQILFGILILTLFLVTGQSCEKEISPICNKPYFEYKSGECCLDSNNNSICDKDENLQIEEKEEIKKEIVTTTTQEKPNANFKIFGAYTFWDNSIKGIYLDVISYEIENMGRELKDVNFDVELYQNNELVTKRNSGIIEDLIEVNKDIVGYKFMKRLAMHPKVIGQADVVLKLKFYLKEGDNVIVEREFPLTYVIRGDLYEVKDLEFDKFEYENTPQRFSSDDVEFTITKRLENSFAYKIQNKGAKTIRNLILDLYCLEEDRGFYFVDYPAYLDDYSYYQAKGEFAYKNIPIELNTGGVISQELPNPYYCSQRTVILRQGRDKRIYLRAF